MCVSEQKFHLNVCPPQERVSNSSKPQSLSVVGVTNVVEDHLSGHAVDGEAQGQHAVDDQGEHSNPNGELHHAQSQVKEWPGCDRDTSQDRSAEVEGDRSGQGVSE